MLVYEEMRYLSQNIENQKLTLSVLNILAISGTKGSSGFGSHRREQIDNSTEKKGFVLNEEPYRSSNIIVAGDNFGCGSSREHAPWALSDFGIKCIISTSFADIFYNNSFKNGLLPIKVTADQREALMADAKDKDNPELEIDLPSQEIRRPNGAVIKFEIDPFRKKCLIEGLDDIGLTMQKSNEIEKFEKKMSSDRPWL